MNATVSQAFIDAEYEKDPASAAAEYGAVFRSDLASYIDAGLIESLIDRGVKVRPSIPGVYYYAFVDASSGQGSDSFTCAVAHKDADGTIVLDYLYERRPPFSPSAVIYEVCGVLVGYKVREVEGDKYAPGLVSELFADNRVSYRYAERDRSAIYVEAMPLLSSGRVRLIDDRRMAAQFVGLDRRCGASGKDVIDHAVGAHDDCANAVAGVLTLVSTGKAPIRINPLLLRRGRYTARPVLMMGGMARW